MCQWCQAHAQVSRRNGVREGTKSLRQQLLGLEAAEPWPQGGTRFPSVPQVKALGCASGALFSYRALHPALPVLEMVTVPEMRKTKTLSQFPGTLPHRPCPWEDNRSNLTDGGNKGDTVRRMGQEPDTKFSPIPTSEELLNTNCLPTNLSAHCGCFKGHRGKGHEINTLGSTEDNG